MENEEIPKYLKLAKIFIQFTISIWKIDEICIFLFRVQQFLDRITKI
jgi:hypothetical protein